MPSAAYDSARDAISRRTIWLLEIDADVCSLDYTTAPCTATDLGDGSRCSYSFPTCQDPTNYSRSTKTWRFSSRDVPWPDPDVRVYPYLVSAVDFAQRVKPDALSTIPAKVVFRLARDFRPSRMHPEKTLSNGPLDGEFWALFLAQNPNVVNRRCRLLRGFPGLSLADFEPVGPDYLVVGWEIRDDEVEITAESRLVELSRARAPLATSDDNVLEGAILAADTAITVSDGSEFPDPSTLSRASVYAEIEDDGTHGSEIVRVDAIAGNVLTVTRGRWGTSAVDHDDQTRIRHVLTLGVDNGSAAPTGTTASDALLDLLDWAGIAPADIDSASFDALDLLWPDLDVLATIRKATSIAKIAAKIRELRQIAILISPTGLFAAATVAPDAAGAPSFDESRIFRGTLRVDVDDEARLTRVSLLYDPSREDSRDVADYRRQVYVIDAALESANYYGDEKEYLALDPYIDPAKPAGEIRALASRLISWRAGGLRTISFSTDERWADAYVGDVIEVSHPNLRDAKGRRTTALVFVTRRRDAGDRVDYVGVDLNAHPLGSYFRIAPNGTTDLASAATAEELDLWGYWGDGDNRVGPEKRPGKVFF